MKRKKEKLESIQTVWITFSNGVKAGFSGKAVIEEGNSAGLKITDIAFTRPKPMPAGYYFVKI